MPPTGQMPAGAPFIVTRQDHEPNLDPSMPGGSTWTIFFRTAGGTDSFITVPEADYTPETVGAQLAARARLIDGVGNLGQPGREH